MSEDRIKEVTEALGKVIVIVDDIAAHANKVVHTINNPEEVFDDIRAHRIVIAFVKERLSELDKISSKKS